MQISILTASRRPAGYRRLLEKLEFLIPEHIKNYLVFVQDNVKDYISIGEDLKIYDKSNIKDNKLRIIIAPKDYIFKNGFDCVYNLLIKSSNSELIWRLSDTDKVDINKNMFEKEVINNTAY